MEAHALSFPLEDFAYENTSQLFSCVWRCTVCDTCQHQDPDYLSTRIERLGRYVEYYRQMTTFYEPFVEPGIAPTLHDHRDLFILIKELKAKSHVSRNQLMAELFNRKCNVSISNALVQDQERALELAIRVVFMVDIGNRNLGIRMVEDGILPPRWSNDWTFTQYMAELFPLTDHPAMNCHESRPVEEISLALKASKIRKRARLKIRPTENLRDHLRLDYTSRTVEIFHHTAFLKEHLRLSYHHRQLNAEAWSNGIIPRQLALEVIDSIQKIIFPLTDPKCRKMLEQLVSTSSFDPDCLRFESASIRSAEERNVAYKYFGSRLADLYEETQNPKPYSLLDKWLERKSGARYTTLVALIGIAIAILLGLLTLVVSIYQAYISYQAWQHPVSNR